MHNNKQPQYFDIGDDVKVYDQLHQPISQMSSIDDHYLYSRQNLTPSESNSNINKTDNKQKEVTISSQAKKSQNSTLVERKRPNIPSLKQAQYLPSRRQERIQTTSNSSSKRHRVRLFSYTPSPEREAQQRQKQSIPEDTISQSENSSQIERVNSRGFHNRLGIPKRSEFDMIVEHEYTGTPIETKKAAFSDEEVKEAFDAFDEDNKGYIDAQDIRLLMDNIEEYVTDEEIQVMIQLLDPERSGIVKFGAFYQMATGRNIDQPQSPRMVSDISIDNKSQLNKTQKSFDSIKLSPSRSSVRSSKIWDDSRIHYSPDTDNKELKRYSKNLSIKTDLFGDQKNSDLTSIMPSSERTETNNMVRVRNLLSTPNASNQVEINQEESTYLVSEAHEDYSQVFIQEYTPQTDSLTSILVNQLVHTTFFIPETIERLIILFRQTTGNSERMSYNQFLQLVNSKLPQDRYLDDDRVTRRIFSVLDKDNDNTLNITEFVMGLSILTRPNKEDQFRLVFRVFDADNDGSISIHELSRILKLNTSLIKSDEQAMKKAQEIVRSVGNHEALTIESFLALKEKPVLLLYPLQERARKIAQLIK